MTYVRLRLGAPHFFVLKALLQLIIFVSLCTLCTIFTIFTTCHAAEDTEVNVAYSAWQQNRAHEAIPLLYAHAQDSQMWFDYYDLGLAAHDNNDLGPAVVWLLQAHQLAPDQDLPLHALHAMQITVPDGYLQILGPLAWLGTGIAGLVCMCIIGFSLVAIVLFPQHRYWSMVVTALVLILSLPGLIAYSLDSQRLLVATVNDCPLLNSSGHSLQKIPEGTVLTVLRQQQDSRILVQLSNGVRGYINTADTQAAPSYNKP